MASSSLPIIEAAAEAAASAAASTLASDAPSSSTLPTSPNMTVPGGTDMSAVTRAVAVYRSAVPRSRVYVGRQYEQAANTGGFLLFADAGSPKRHPHNHDAIVYSYGELCVWDPCVIERMDAAVRRNSVAFWRVKDPQPISA